GFEERMRAFGLLRITALAILLCVPLALSGTSRAQEAGQLDEWKVDPLRGPIDLGLTDPALVGAIDVHVHLDPDAPGPSGVIRALDVFDAVALAKARGMRGFVFKTHQDAGSAGAAYLVRRHAPGLEVFGRMASNYSTGGVNVATLVHYSRIKGGWGRIFEMPTLDSITATTRPGSMDPQNLERTRPWMLTMPEGTPPYIAVSKNGELLPEVKHLISVLAKIRTVDSNGPLVPGAGQAPPGRPLPPGPEGRRPGLKVLLTPPRDFPPLPEAAKLGAFVEVTASTIYKTEAARAAAAALIRKIGAE